MPGLCEHAEQGSTGLPSLSLQKGLVPMLIRQKPQESTPKPSNSAKPDSQSTGNLPGQSPSSFLPLELQTHPRLALEEVALELQPNFPMLGGSQKSKPVLSGLLATEGNILCQALVPLDRKGCSGFQQPSPNGYPEVHMSILTELCW